MNIKKFICNAKTLVFGRLTSVRSSGLRNSQRGSTPILRLPWRLVLAAFLVASSLWLPQTAGTTYGSSSDAWPDVPSNEAFVPNEVLVGLKPEVVQSLIQQGTFGAQSVVSAFGVLNEKYGVQQITPVFPQVDLTDPVALAHGLAGVFKLTVPEGTNIFAMISEYQSHPAVAYAEPNLIFHATNLPIPNDPEFNAQWGLHNTGQTGGTPDADIDAPEAWQITMGSPDTLIAVLDTGVNYNHPDLQGQVRTDIDKDFVNNDNDAMDDHGHGTFCAGIISAKTNNAAGIAGVCPNCKILPVKVLNSNGSGTSDNVARGIRYAADMQAKIISMSLGYKSSCGCSKTVAQAINYAFERGSLLIAASGNDEDKQRMSYPASSPRVMSVGATDHRDREAYFSNRSSQLDIYAPGVSVRSLDLQGYRTASGTSAATPHVAGAAGLLWTVYPALTNVQVWWLLRHSADDMPAQATSLETFATAELSEAQASNLRRRVFIPRVALSPVGVFVRTTVGRLNAHRAFTLSRRGEVYAPVDTCNSEPNCLGGCAAEVTLSGTANEHNDLRLLRDLADRVMASSEIGQEWIALYQRHRLESALILATDGELRAQTLAALGLWLPVFRALTYPDNNAAQQVVITQAHAEALEQVIAGLSARASDALRADLERVQQTLQIRRFVGQEAQSAWQALNASR
ncbi:MAG: S8 family peptidase [Anaerolineae bacterium]|nr:S8 family serine peptidase [Thermoflexales bacterium]MDW8394739.1 S8 family peptidase [Anaerolineae bacterium]